MQQKLILKIYKICKKLQKNQKIEMDSNKIFVIMGKSASGKDTSLRKLVSDKNVETITSYTTRPMRPGEVNGIDYRFVNNFEFLWKLIKGEFIESQYYESYVNDKPVIWFYGMPKLSHLVEHTGFAVILETRGLLELRERIHNNIYPIYLDVPQEIRKHRFKNRLGNEKPFPEKEYLKREEVDAEIFKESTLNSIEGLKRFSNNEDAENYIIENTKGHY